MENVGEMSLKNDEFCIIFNTLKNMDDVENDECCI